MIDGSNPSTQQQCWASLVSIILWQIFILKQCLAVQSRGSSIGNRGVVSSSLADEEVPLIAQLVEHEKAPLFAYSQGIT